jgi:hypothetical protein
MVVPGMIVVVVRLGGFPRAASGEYPADREEERTIIRRIGSRFMMSS